MLKDLLEKKKAAILERWFQLILETYPADTAIFLRRERDRFVNPVGHTLSQETKTLYECLSCGIDSEKACVSLENIIRIRTVQDFSPSEAVQFVHCLKTAVKEELAQEMRGEEMLGEWLKFESDVDHLSLLAFDIYMKCREKISDIRINEMRKERDRAMKLMARSGIITNDQ